MIAFQRSRLPVEKLLPNRRYRESESEHHDGLTAVESARSMKSEKQRLDTFWNWPAFANQHPKSLAKAGFYYTGISDRVKCPFCSGILKNWKASDDPVSEHWSHFPYCSFVRDHCFDNIHSSECKTGGQNTKTPLSLDMKTEENRVKTFTVWPSHLEQTPQALARAGFYFCGDRQKKDRVKCAYCNGRLYDWQPGDDPWLEHARYFPQCPYIKLCLGEEYINDIQEQIGVAINQSEPKNSNFREFMCNDQTSSATCTPSAAAAVVISKNQQIKRETETIMKSCQVEAVLELGYSRDLVESVIESRLRDKGEGFANAEELASVVMEMESDRKNEICERNEVKHYLNTFTAGYEEKSGNLVSYNRYLCKVCMENKCQMTFAPCGHLVCCGQCALVVDNCPVCRTTVSGMIKTFY